MLLLFVLVFLLLQFVHGQDLTVTVRQGPVRGFREESGRVISFLGIPYAEPPIGDLRFKSPESAGGWRGTLNADRFKDNCPQPGGDRGARYSEDCLYLNIWIPEISRYDKYPVAVFLEGEFFTYSSPSKFNGRDLATQRVVVVSVQYRVNVFGFLSLESDEAGTNVGLRDQVEALEWVRDNIDSFGGDTSKITLMGHGAGAASVGYHLLSPQSRGLFHYAIMMSGSPLSLWAFTERPLDHAQEIGRELRCRTYDSRSLLSCLRDQDSQRLLEAFQDVVNRPNSTTSFSPSIDNFLPRDEQMVAAAPIEMLSRYGYSGSRVPVMLGVTENEGVVMLYAIPSFSRMSSRELIQYMRNTAMPSLAAQVTSQRDVSSLILQAIDFFYADIGDSERKTDVVEKIDELFGDSYFKASVLKFAELLAENRQTVYMYVFTETGPDIYGNNIDYQNTASHGSELLYLFGPTAYESIVQRSFGYSEDKISREMKDFWVKFMNDGSPTRDSRFRWEPFTSTQPRYFFINTGSTRNDYRPQQMTFWNEFLPELSRMTTPLPTRPTYPTYPNTNTPQAITAQPYYSLTWVLLAVVALLLLALILTVVVMRRRRDIDHNFSVR